ncbi:MAG: hypothetical protein ABS87_10930 [Sphingomonas sp. SCN 67-18]|uniref:hypothetical protein n=1 Tax=uncultured Sphingomonas sp. TaxID=158754 RepID=UPI00086E87A9|nr:hypothetical protein [Sphingomonas sp. SCN 67-18]ODU20539.1 MAG: hypothetical protein ABS87_10930 [Sphingomonas sp. SCN 67-18]
MSFQPFGYKFEIQSPVSREILTSRIRARKKGWFHPKTGARGWIVGPFICLWFSAFDRHGPMVVGALSDDGLTCRVKGRAGSNLNGVMMFALMLPFLVWLVWMSASEGDPAAGRLALIVAIFVLLSPLIFWLAHSDRKDAEPLVRFLRDVASEGSTSPRPRPQRIPLPENLVLRISGDLAPPPLNTDVIYEALLETGTDEFIVLERSAERYLQTASRGGKFTIEMRDGDYLHHYQALRTNRTQNKRRKMNFDFSFEETLDTVLAYVTGNELPKLIAWEKMDMAAPTAD